MVAGGTSLSVCLIVRDEEEMLGDCLASVADLADQLVVVDTGSNDRTIEIARECGAEVHHFEWCDDFSAARNASITHATGDWILWLDADERLEVDSIPELKRCLRRERRPVIYRVRIRNVKADGKSTSLSDAHRLFTRHPGIRFDGIIHEQISPSAHQVGAEERGSQIFLYHLGYGLEGAAAAAKQARNRTLLEKRVQEHPDDAYAHYTLAHNYREAKELEAAIDHYRKALNLGQFAAPMKASLHNALADVLLDLGQEQEAQDLIEWSLGRFPRQIAAYYLLFRLAEKQTDLTAASAALQAMQQQLPDISRHGSDLSTDVTVDSEIIAKTLDQLAVRRFNDSLEKADYVQALEIAEPYATDPWRERQALVCIKLGRFEEAIDRYHSLLQTHPGNENLIKRIAALYAKLGRREEAVKLLAAIQS